MQRVYIYVSFKLHKQHWIIQYSVVCINININININIYIYIDINRQLCQQHSISRGGV